MLTPRRHSGPLVYFLLGALALVVQTILIRQLLTVFAGNELDIGLTLAAWLLFFGIGSITGRTLPGGNVVFGLSLLAAGLMVQPTVYGMRALRTIMALSAGEIPTVSRTLFATCACIAPVAWLTGTLFPQAVRHAEGHPYAAGRVYVLEALGAMAGGVFFMFVLSTRVNALHLSGGLAAAYVVLAVTVARKPFLLALLLLPAALHVLAADRVRHLAFDEFDVVAETESRFGEVTLVSSHGQYTVFESGSPRFSFPDPQSDETTVHTAMTLHPAPRAALVIGGTPGQAREFLKYPAVQATFVEENPALWEMAAKAFSTGGPVLPPSPRVEHVSKGGRSFLAGDPRTWDLILLEVPPPSTAATNRYFTTEFFRLASERLSPTGMLVLRGIPAFGYMGRATRDLNGTLYRTLKAVFTHVTPGAQETGLLIASSTPVVADPDVLEERFGARGVATVAFSPLVFRDVFAPLNVTLATGNLEDGGDLNRDAEPVAYRIALARWADLQKSGVLGWVLNIPAPWTAGLIGGSALLGALATAGHRSRAAGLAVFTTGAASMGLALSVILCFQAFHGYVYEAVALLTAAFMGGSAVGGRIPGALALGRVRGPAGMLLASDGLFVLLLWTVPFLLGGTASFYAASFAGGLLTGLAFGAANLVVAAGGSSPRTAGWIYGLDLVGSCLGALLPALLLIPRLGIGRTLAVISLVKVFSFAALAAAVRSGTQRA